MSRSTLKVASSLLFGGTSHYLLLSQRPEDLWALHSLSVSPKPHKRDNSSWKAIEKVCSIFYFTRDILYDCSRKSRVKLSNLHDIRINFMSNCPSRSPAKHFSVYEKEMGLCGPRSKVSVINDRVPQYSS
jgi:hypothetical protein